MRTDSEYQPELSKANFEKRRFKKGETSNRKSKLKHFCPEDSISSIKEVSLFDYDKDYKKNFMPFPNFTVQRAILISNGWRNI